jgi:hypothetical protein
VFPKEQELSLWEGEAPAEPGADALPDANMARREPRPPKRSAETGQTIRHPLAGGQIEDQGRSLSSMRGNGIVSRTW